MLLTLLSTAFADPGHLFILSGQSNMERWDEKKKFLPTVKKAMKPDPVWHIKVAHGGTPIRRWVQNWDEIAKEEGIKKRPKPVKADYYDEILSAFRVGVKEHGRPKTITLVWVQGEADARRGFAAAYPRALRALVGQLKQDLDAPGLGVVVGRLSDWEPASPDAKAGWTTVRQAQVEFAQGSKRHAWVDADDVNNIGSKKKPVEDIHYSKKGYKVFATRLALQAVRLAKKQKPVKNGRP